MRKRIFAAAATLFLVAPMGAAAQTTLPAAEPTPSETQAPLSIRLAQAAFPKEMLPAFAANFAVQFEAGMKEPPRGQRMEKLFPGFTHQFTLRALPEVQKAALQRLPTMHKRAAALYDTELSPAEQEEYLAFLQSPAGQSLIRSVGKSYDIQTLAQSVSQTGKISEETAEQQRELLMLSLKSNVEEAHAAAIKKFGTSPLGVKVGGVEEKMHPLFLEFANQPPDPAVVKRIDAIALRVAQEMARKKK